MTLQEAQEAIAKDYGYKSWYEIDPTNVSMDQVWKDVALLYAESAILHLNGSYEREIKYLNQLNIDIHGVVHGPLSDGKKVARIKELLS